MQPSLFTRLQAVEAELQAMKDLLAELTVNQDGLRRDRDEWRWRAERLLKDRERGMFWRWRSRADATLDSITASSRKLIVGLRAKLDESIGSRIELRQYAARLARSSRATCLGSTENGGTGSRGQPYPEGGSAGLPAQLILGRL